MRDYEIVYIFRSTFTPEEIEAKLERYHGILTAGGQGEITAVEQWGKRQLAYPIEKQANGHYVVAQFTAEPEPLAELERVLKLEDDLLRYLVVLSEGELPLPESMRETPTAPAPAKGAAKETETPAESTATEGEAPATDEAPTEEAPTEDEQPEAGEEAPPAEDETAEAEDEPAETETSSGGEEESGDADEKEE